VVAVRHIVVVEDDPLLLEMIGEVLEFYDFSHTGVDTAQRVHTDVLEPPALFLIDIMLPGVNGIDLARELRAGRFASTPMIAMSASDAMLQAAFDSGHFQGVLSKPFELTDLISCIERGLS